MAQGILPVNQEIVFLEKDLDDPHDYMFAIVVSRYQDKWVWVRHKERLTWELPAGHLEPGETAEQAACRELFEETGALEYTLIPVGSYLGNYKGNKVHGMIFLADISHLGPLPDHEIAEIRLDTTIPVALTYPEIQPLFFNKALALI